MNICKIVLTCCWLLMSGICQAQMYVAAAFCDNRVNPTGIDLQQFFFSWELGAKKNNQRQNAYQFVVASSKADLLKGNYNIYNSGKVVSDQNIQISYKGQALQPGRQYYWRVRVWNLSQVISSWSDAQWFTTGIFEPTDWNNAKWIGAENALAAARVVPFVHGKMKESDPRLIRNTAAPLLRKTFQLHKPVQSALLFISGLGHYQVNINGEKIGRAFLAPGWTNYDKTILYNTYDVTNNLQAGGNALGVLLGNGFYHISQERYVKGTGSFGKPKLIAQLKILYRDGSTEFIVTDSSWRTKPSAVTFNNIYGGEDFDARQWEQGWTAADYDDRNWKQALPVLMPRGKLVPEIDYPVAIMDTLMVQNSWVINDSITVYDFGQNVSGVPCISVKGKPGQTVKLIPSELVLEDGRVNQADGVTPHYYQYTLGSTGKETWYPGFTYFAVRYVQVVTTTTDKPVITQMRLFHTRNSTPVNGHFTCSDTLLNKIYTLIDWAVRSNIQSYITDNPQREKLSWQGEQNFMRTAIHYGYDVYNLYRSLVQNMKDAQHANGLVPDIAPEYIQFDGPFVDSPEWGTTAILDAWFLYKYYGDTAIIRSAYPMMKAYANYLQTRADDNLLLYGLGDWLDVGNKTPKGITATAYYFKAIEALSEMAVLVGEKSDALTYKNLSENIRRSFNSKFFNEEKRLYGTGSQTAMAMPLSMGMVEQKYKADVLNNLVQQVERVDSNRLTAGDVGHKFLVSALYENGHSDVLYNITHRDDSPGYAYQLKKGATALVETWDGKASQNQLAMGHILEWFYEGIAGIRQQPGATAFKNILIQPQLVKGIHSAAGRFHSPYGWIETNWKYTGEQFSMTVSIPVNTGARVALPALANALLYIDGRPWKNYTTDQRQVAFFLPSGTYHITLMPSPHR